MHLSGDQVRCAVAGCMLRGPDGFSRVRRLLSLVHFEDFRDHPGDTRRER
jgi:hypothetical protein